VDIEGVVVGGGVVVADIVVDDGEASTRILRGRPRFFTTGADSMDGFEESSVAVEKNREERPTPNRKGENREADERVGNREKEEKGRLKRFLTNRNISRKQRIQSDSVRKTCW
jgi:hypothetical protein